MSPGQNQIHDTQYDLMLQHITLQHASYAQTVWLTSYQSRWWSHGRPMIGLFTALCCSNMSMSHEGTDGMCHQDILHEFKPMCIKIALKHTCHMKWLVVVTCCGDKSPCVTGSLCNCYAGTTCGTPIAFKGERWLNANSYAKSPRNFGPNFRPWRTSSLYRNSSEKKRNQVEAIVSRTEAASAMIHKRHTNTMWLYFPTL